MCDRSGSSNTLYLGANARRDDQRRKMKTLIGEYDPPHKMARPGIAASFAGHSDSNGISPSASSYISAPTAPSFDAAAAGVSPSASQISRYTNQQPRLAFAGQAPAASASAYNKRYEPRKNTTIDQEEEASEFPTALSFASLSPLTTAGPAEVPIFTDVKRDLTSRFEFETAPPPPRRRHEPSPFAGRNTSETLSAAAATVTFTGESTQN